MENETATTAKTVFALIGPKAYLDAHAIRANLLAC